MVDIWCVDLNEDGHEFKDWLSADELIRVEKLGNRYLVSRGYLRKILAGYLGINPWEICFGYGVYGKPHIVNSSLGFNLSHSGDLAVYGIGFDRQIGVDIEYIKNRPYGQLVKRFFSTNEQVYFNSLPVEKQGLGFFRGWTIKEAYLKACGTGISQSLSDVEVSLDWERSPEVYDPLGWYCQDLILPKNYMGAIVSNRIIDRLTYY
jgi:4'-phosphopantetheinyl transferase